MYLYICRDADIPYGQKLDTSGACFGWYVLALSVRKRIFLKTKKADQKQCENWRRESGSDFHKTSPTCERGGWRKQTQDFSTQSLKQPPLGSCAISRLFWPDGYKCRDADMSLYKCSDADMSASLHLRTFITYLYTMYFWVSASYACVTRMSASLPHIQPIPLAVTCRKLKAQSSNVSFATFQ